MWDWVGDNRVCTRYVPAPPPGACTWDNAIGEYCIEYLRPGRCYRARPRCS
jgi:hypothetical protein